MTTTTPRQVLALCRTSEVGTIRTFCGEDEARTKAVMRLHLVNLNATCDVKKPLTEAQIEFIIDTITHDWQLKGLTLVDFMVVMRRAATGEYGEMFESLSPPKVLGWLKKYADERATVAGEMSREENEGYKGDASRSRYNKEQAAKSEEEGHHRAMLQALQERVRKQQKNKE